MVFEVAYWSIPFQDLVYYFFYLSYSFFIFFFIIIIFIMYIICFPIFFFFYCGWSLISDVFMNPFRDDKSWVLTFIIVTRNGDSLETWAILIEISVMLKLTERHKTPGITFKKHCFLWWESPICRWFLC